MAIAGLALAGGIWVGARGAGPVPPLGPLLDPVHGAWATARTAELPRSAAADIPGLSAPVDVRYDRRGVPHIFAATEDDAIRALGYVVARDRLFQLDVQTHAASGRLTEWAGRVALGLDQETRHIGLPRAAERLAAALDSGNATRRLIDAYADGVNAYIDHVAPDEWPVEYRLLNQRPERWKPINSLYLIGRMSYTLTYFFDEAVRLRAQALVGRSAAQALFPVNTPIQEPIQPNGQTAPRFDFTTLPPPGLPDSLAAHAAAMLPLRPALLAEGSDARIFASNNWAVAPRRSESKYALLAGDPHLELTLPSIWYEAHLVVPGKLDAYGVTIPGLPGIVIGFTRDVAWSFTNTGADVLDFYWETLDDASRPTRYQVDGMWRPLESRVESYRGKRGEVLAVDTVRYTHRGPVDRWPGSGGAVSMRWTALEKGVELVAFQSAAHARTTREFLDSMALHYTVPAQNIIVADRAGTIGIRSTGHYPIRPDSGDGLTVRDGSHSSNDWQGYWPLDKYPQSIDPSQGYLASANQQPIDPKSGAAYLGSDRGFEPWRALQINRLLRADSAMTLSDMRRFQTDPGSVRADLFLPFFLDAAMSRRTAAINAPRLDSAAAMLRPWDRRYTRDQDAAALFESAMRALSRATWDELADSTGRPFATPSAAVLLQLLHDSANVWWDSGVTRQAVEHRDDVVASSLIAAWDTLTARYGPPSAGRWRWSERGAANVRHLLQLPGFSEMQIPIQGGPGTLNPSSGNFGSSWRMVVEMGPTVRAFGTYPGG
ncbi:MAG: penicillin acylase family protein, partial [Gemmatimonadaceae bacterium]